METTNTQAVQDDEISLKELIIMLRKWFFYILSKWLIILIIAILGAALGYTYANSRKPIYSAACTFVLEEGSNTGGVSQYAGIASMVGIDLNNSGGGIFQSDNIIELYKSRTMIEKTLLSEVDINGESQLLIERYIEFNNLRKSWNKKPELKNIRFKNITFTRLQDSILGIISNDIKKAYLSVEKPDKKLSIIKVEVKANDEIFAKTFNDQIVKKVNDFYVQTKTKKALENVLILQRKTDSVRAVMNGAIYTAAAVSDATPNLNPTHQVQRVVPVQRAQISVETNKVILGELVKNLELSKMSLHRETPLIQVVDSPVFPLEKERFSKSKGIVFGVGLASALCILYLLIKKLLQDALKD